MRLFFSREIGISAAVESALQFVWIFGVCCVYVCMQVRTSLNFFFHSVGVCLAVGKIEVKSEETVCFGSHAILLLFSEKEKEITCNWNEDMLGGVSSDSEPNITIMEMFFRF